MFQVYDLTLIGTNKAEIFSYLNTISLKNIGTLKEVLLSNINRVEKRYNDNLLHNIKEKELSIDSFKFKIKPDPNNLSWQENTIVNMLDTTFIKSEFLPEINFLASYPNIGSWNEKL